MNLTERKSKSINRKNKLEQLLSQRFESVYIKGNLCFCKQNGAVFSLCAFPKDAAIVIEYADSIEEAKINRFEDGDMFYVEEMDEETMLQAVLREINQ